MKKSYNTKAELKKSVASKNERLPEIFDITSFCKDDEISFSPDLDVNHKLFRSSSTAARERLIKLLQNHLWWSSFSLSCQF